MRKALLTLTALAGLFGAGALTPASAQPVAAGFDPAAVQTVQYYGGYGGYGGYGWRHRDWERHRRWVEWHRYHRGYDRGW